MLFLRRNERRIFGVVLSCLLLSCCLVPVAPLIGYSLKQKMCESFGECEKYVELLASCSEEDNVQVLARERRVVYAEGVAPGESALAFYANEEAGIVFGNGRIYERFRFFQPEEALRWLVGRDPKERLVVDLSQGPAKADVSERLQVGLARAGFSSREGHEAVSKIEVDSFSNRKFLVEKFSAPNDSVRYRATQVVDRPEDNLDGLSRFYSWLGLQAPFLVQVDFNDAFAPVSMRLAGFGRENWSVRELGDRRLGLSRINHLAANPAGEITLRSYELDLQAEKNQDAYQNVAAGWPGRNSKAGLLVRTEYEKAQEGQLNNYQLLGERLLSDGKLVESSYRVSGPVNNPFELLLRIETQIPVSVSNTPELKDATVRDFSRPESGQKRLVNCSAHGGAQ